MKLSRSAAFLFTFTAVILASGAGCLRSLELHPVSTPTGTGLETCITIASASPPSSGPSVASAAPPAPSAGVLRHAQ